MADGLDESRTEAPTPRRREEAREQGQVAVSQDLASSLVLLAGLAALALGAAALGGGLLEAVRHDMLLAGRIRDADPEQARTLLAGMFGRGLELVGLLLGLVFAVAVGAGAAQVGFRLAPQLLAVNWERLSPAQGWTRLLSLSGGVKTLLSVLKVALVFAVAVWVLRGRVAEIGGMQQVTLAATVARAWQIVLYLGLAVAGTLGLLGLADYAWQWWRLERSLRMTRQEIKEEHKREEGDPQVKARVRRLQREAAKKRMYQDVPTATVVVTNPTHLAVALRYDRQGAGAPRVVAKGAGFVAARIVALARRHAVPVLERKPVAQALFKTVKVGQQIPVALYQVVAEVLAYVFRARGG
jgi:flagellar biosynthetic protein FlhB